MLRVMRHRRPPGRARVELCDPRHRARPRDNFLLSGDLMGEASARIEREIGRARALRQRRGGRREPPAAGLGRGGRGRRRLAARCVSRLAGSRPIPPRRPRTSVTALASASRRRAAELPRALGARRHAPGSARPRCRRQPSCVAVAVGRTGWVTIPGELAHELGLEIKAAGAGGFDHVFVAGVSNDYLGYFLAPEHYWRPSYIACASLYGERGGAGGRATRRSTRPRGRLAERRRSPAAGREPAARVELAGERRTSCGRRCCGGMTPR